MIWATPVRSKACRLLRTVLASSSVCNPSFSRQPRCSSPTNEWRSKMDCPLTAGIFPSTFRAGLRHSIGDPPLGECSAHSRLSRRSLLLYFPIIPWRCARAVECLHQDHTEAAADGLIRVNQPFPLDTAIRSGRQIRAAFSGRSGGWITSLFPRTATAFFISFHFVHEIRENFTSPCGPWTLALWLLLSAQPVGGSHGRPILIDTEFRPDKAWRRRAEFLSCPLLG